LGFSAQKNEKLSKLPTFSPTGANPSPLFDVREIRSIYAGNRSTEVIYT